MKVTLAYPHTDADGNTHDADTSLELPADVAIRLLDTGRARAADASTTAEPGTPEETN